MSTKGDEQDKKIAAITVALKIPCTGRYTRKKELNYLLV